MATKDIDVPIEIITEYVSKVEGLSTRLNNWRLDAARIVDRIMADRRLKNIKSGIGQVTRAVADRLNVTPNELTAARTIVKRFGADYLKAQMGRKDDNDKPVRVFWGIWKFVSRLPEKQFPLKQICAISEFLHNGGISLEDSRIFCQWYKTHYELMNVAEAFAEWEKAVQALANANTDGETADGETADGENTETETADGENTAHNVEQVEIADLKQRLGEALASLEQKEALLSKSEIQVKDLQAILKDKTDSLSLHQEEHRQVQAFTGQKFSPREMAGFLESQAKVATVKDYQEMHGLARIFFSAPDGMTPGQLVQHMQNLRTEEEALA